MRSKLIHITGYCLMASSLVLSTSVKAQAQTQEDQEMGQVMQEMKSMQRQVNALNAEVKALKQENNGLRRHNHSSPAHHHSRVHHVYERPFEPPIFNGPSKPAKGVEIALPALQRHCSKQVLSRWQTVQSILRRRLPQPRPLLVRQYRPCWKRNA